MAEAGRNRKLSPGGCPGPQGFPASVANASAGLHGAGKRNVHRNVAEEETGQPAVDEREDEADSEQHDAAPVDLDATAVQKRDDDEPALERQALQVFLDVIAADHIEHDVDATILGDARDLGHKIVRPVIDCMTCDSGKSPGSGLPTAMPPTALPSRISGTARMLRNPLVADAAAI